MKVLHIINSLQTGGAQRMLVKLIAATSNEIEHSIITIISIGTQGKVLQEMGLNVYELRTRSAIKLFSLIRKIYKIIKYEKPDILQGWMYYGNLAAIISGFIFNKLPVVYNIRHSVHDLNIEKKSTRWSINLNKIFSYKTSTIIYNSKVSKLQHEKIGFSKKNSIVIPNGFDINKFSLNLERRRSFRKKINIPDDNIILFGMVCRNNPIKDIDNFINAAAKVYKTNKEVVFLIAGRRIPDDADLKNLIHNHGIENKFVLLDEINEVENLWNGVDFAILSSKSEGFPNVLGEAMACEKICIATDVGDSSFIIGDTGCVVPPQNNQALAEAMKKMARIPHSEKINLGKKARKRIMENFTIEEVSIQYISLYKSILIVL